MRETRYTHRYMARIVMEAVTPVSVKSGKKSVMTDALVIRDVNGLPFIPGTSLAGVLRHIMGEDPKKEDSLFGYQDGEKGSGSRLIFSDAVMIGKEGKAMDGLCEIDFQDEFYSHFRDLPIRQHVRIEEHGVGADHGKFDEEVVFRGTRFIFDVELLSAGTQEEEAYFKEVLHKLYGSSFRIGSGTRCGFGEMKIVSCRTAFLNLRDEADMEKYLNKSSDLSEEADCFDTEFEETHYTSEGWTAYTLSLHPEDFFLFGSGFGDDDADMTPLEEGFIKWKDGTPEFVPNIQTTVIPATSIKGAIAHRTAYHWNKLNHRFADNDDGLVGDENPAVATLFGTSEDGSDIKISRGNVMFTGLVKEYNERKLLNHVAIDRFTGGAINGALFTEKTVDGSNMEHFTINIYVADEALTDETIVKSFELSLEDLSRGMLPLGGGVNRGHGIFTGTWKKEEK